jgi:DNA-binding NarL/FixJ family response regulator
MRKITLVLADDHVLFCESLQTVLEIETEDIRVLGIARTGREAVDLVEEHHPDIVLMDVRMPEMDGVEATRLILQRFPGVRVMMLTTFDDDEYVREAVRHGAVGYLLKDVPLDRLIMVIREASKGVVMISPAVALRLRSEPPDTLSGAPAAPDWVRLLSPREKEILQLLGQGHDNGEIARALFIAEQTVKNHISDIYLKLGVHERGKAMRMVADLRLDIRLS